MQESDCDGARGDVRKEVGGPLLRVSFLSGLGVAMVRGNGYGIYMTEPESSSATT
ncbi:hypothetical protein MIDIC_410014 [Alphaproteobacteria bacterium]